MLRDDDNYQNMMKQQWYTSIILYYKINVKARIQLSIKVSTKLAKSQDCLYHVAASLSLVTSVDPFSISINNINIFLKSR